MYVLSCVCFLDGSVCSLDVCDAYVLSTMGMFSSVYRKTTDSGRENGIIEPDKELTVQQKGNSCDKQNQQAMGYSVTSAGM